MTVVAGCCDSRGCGAMFGPGFARQSARRYRRRGLDRTAQRIVDEVSRHGVDGVTVLEIGGGVGGIQLELLKRGATRTTNVELSTAYDREAEALLAETGMAGRVTRRIVDIAADPETVEPADVVVLHRVVCCYPDYVRLLTAAADHARRQVVFSYPRRNALSRALVTIQNAWYRVRGHEYRAFVHPPQAMLEVLAGRGMQLTYAAQAAVWQVAGVTRTTTVR